MHIYIDGKKLIAMEGETILEVARRNDIEIPTLCHHEALEPVGACRLCTVEISHKDWNGWKGMVTSCLYPVEEGLEIATANKPVRELRQTVLDLLVARCPESEVIRFIAEQNGEPITHYEPFEDGSKCIMCYQCVRACEAVGCSAISAVNRGPEKEIATPFHGESDQCVGCGSCASICPTGHIRMIDNKKTRKIWNREFKFAACDKCGEPVMTEAYRDFAIENRELPNDYYTTCSECKKKTLADHLFKVGS